MLYDVRYAVRGIARNQGFATAAILTLALGIGSVTSIFSVADALLLRPLPYLHQDRLVTLYDQLTRLRQDRFPLNYRTFTAYSQSAVFERTGEFRPYDTTVTGAGEATRVIADDVSASLMPMLGVAPAIGRGFTEAENRPGHGNVAILSHEFFRGRFGGDRSALGRAIALDGHPCTIIGVMPPAFEFSLINERTDIWTPMELREGGPWTGGFYVLARLRPGTSVAGAQAALDRIAKHLNEGEHIYRGPNGEDAGYRVKVISLHDDIFGRFRLTTILLLSAVAAVLVIALVNVSNLLLVRAVSREREFAVRRAVGASEAQLARQWIVEAAVLAGIGGSLGAIASVWGVRALVRLSPAAVPAVTRVGIDARALALTISIAALISIVLGLTPLLANGSNLRGDHRQRRAAPALIAAEVALATILLASASLLLKSYESLRRVDVGFRPERLLTMHVDLPHLRYPAPRDRGAFEAAVHDRLAALPGVISAALVTRLPVNGATPGSRGGNPFSIEGRPWNPNAEIPQMAHTQSCDPDYFRTMQIPLVAGRVFTDADSASSPMVAVVNETLARRFFPKGALGEHIMLGAPRSGYPWLTIVGVVGDVKTAALDEPTMPQFYRPLTQDASPWLDIALRTYGDPQRAARDVTTAIHSVDPDRPVYYIETMERRIAATISQPRFETVMVGWFALAALFLAATGIFGVVAHSTAQRTREIGIRMALGADHARVMRHVMLTGLRPVAIGAVIGVTGALGAGKMLAAFLFHVSPSDPATLLTAVAALIAVAIAACLVPARRATEIDPARALGSE